MFVFEIEKAICILLVMIFFTFGPSSGLKLIDFNKIQSKNEQDLSLLKNIIQAVPEMIQLNTLDKEISGEDEMKVLLKTIVPHKKPYTIEYDRKSNALYIPFVRIHKTLKTKQKPNIYIITEDNQEVPSKKNFLEHLKLHTQIEKLTQKLDNRIKKVKKYDKLVRLLKYMLRTPQFVKSGEESNPLAEDEVLETEKKKVWMPHYPHWNYWTYKKTIHQDECPGNQVKIGNMCIWIPPH